MHQDLYLVHFTLISIKLLFIYLTIYLLEDFLQNKVLISKIIPIMRQNMRIRTSFIKFIIISITKIYFLVVRYSFRSIT